LCVLAVVFLFSPGAQVVAAEGDERQRRRPSRANHRHVEG
jgi:hypothetical protein